MERIRTLCVGRMKSGFCREGCAHYRQRLSRLYSVREMEVADSRPGSEAVRVEEEGKSLLARVRGDCLVVCMDEGGAAWSTTEFASRLRAWVEIPSRIPCFVLGGAFGLSRNVLEVAHVVLSLGPMTLPHELARLVLYEQLYRAATINWNRPYHHAGRREG
ncbi:MAG: 23S rRNA (pseudouridine(1915)-N(3))-methyltransferase RlmH [Deltaproteobacteria bacterium]|nr:23S rRNA (pseudouridine(1915)-N(3))-methyltransferase RlmH [Deltaproteobacteria bacterium]